MKENLIQYIYGIGDNCLILGQRLGEWCGHGPSLETDIALTNISLDLFGQTRSYFQYAAQLLGAKATEDTVAFLRYEHEYRNVLLVELPNKDFAYTVARQYLFDVYHKLLLTELQNSKDETLSVIAKKSLKEVNYHVRFSGDWVIRLGDGTHHSHEKIQKAIDDLWPYIDELFHQTEADKVMIDEGVGVDTSMLKEKYYDIVKALLIESTLAIPEGKYFHKGGKNGVHTEHMGYLLAEMQYMQRAYPNMTW
jgi:ring-1,2-phenylacetyl-CoA epoxidase subunit PaaC